VPPSVLPSTPTTRFHIRESRFPPFTIHSGWSARIFLSFSLQRCFDEHERSPPLRLTPVRLMRSWVRSSAAYCLGLMITVVACVIWIERGSGASTPSLESSRSLWCGDLLSCLDKACLAKADSELSTTHLACKHGVRGSITRVIVEI